MTESLTKAPKTGGIWFLLQRRFAPLFILLQTGTFNDNALKNALIALITFGGVVFLADLPSAIRVPVAAFIFTGPFLLVCVDCVLVVCTHAHTKPLGVTRWGVWCGCRRVLLLALWIR